MNSEQIYNLALNIPVSFQPVNMPELDNISVNKIHNLSKDDINKIWLDWLAGCGMSIKQSYIFCAKGDTRYNLHTDRRTEPLNRHAKINYIYGGANSYMQWFQLKEGRTAFEYRDPIGSHVWGIQRGRLQLATRISY